MRAVKFNEQNRQHLPSKFNTVEETKDQLYTTHTNIQMHTNTHIHNAVRRNHSGL